MRWMTWHDLVLTHIGSLIDLIGSKPLTSKRSLIVPAGMRRIVRKYFVEIEMSDDIRASAVPAPGCQASPSAADASSQSGIPDADDLPAFPFFEVDGPTAAFGCDEKHYLSYADASRAARALRKEASVFSALFFEGGSLAQHGLQWKPEYASKGMATLRALMCSFAPQHQVKEGTVALALHRWCEPLQARGEAA